MGIKLIGYIENLHNEFLVHSDIRPQNILLDLKHDDEYSIINFGKCAKFEEFKNGSRRHYRNTPQTFIGDYWFSSPNMLAGQRPTRRDDIISIIYTMMYMANKLPNLKALRSNEAIKEYKIKTSAKDFCWGMERFGPILQEAYSYEFT